MPAGGDEPQLAFPGLYCPGLIEAAASTSAPGRGRTFPGLYCPGLIEARCHGPNAWWLLRFRGSIAPASLKRHRLLRVEEGVAVFPGLYCPGLIEAGKIDPLVACFNAVSGALLPRPH